MNIKGNIVKIFLLLVIFSFAFFVRVYFCYDKVFSSPIKYSFDDGVYHMRLVENELLGNHFPNRIYFDPYTYFPNGTYVYFAPLYDQLLAGVIWMAGFGHPTLNLINKIAPFYPAILGSLVVFLIYLVSNALWGVKTALFSAFLMAISQPYLFRSLLGANDHHAGEVFFSSLTMMFLIFTLKERKLRNYKKEKRDRYSFNIKRDVSENRKFWLLTFCTGISLGLYFLTWSGALLFLAIIADFIVFYYLFEYLSGELQGWILMAGILIFMIVLVMIVPLFGHPDLSHALMYNVRHLECLVLGIIGFTFIWLFGNLFANKRIKPKFFLIFLVFSALVFLFALRLAFPLGFSEIVNIIQMVNTGVSPNKFAREVTAEMQPLSLSTAINNFGSLFYLSLVALIIIFYKFIKERKPEYLLVFIWTTVIILMTGIIPLFGQNRIIYYLSFNVSLLSGFLIIKGFNFGWRSLKIAEEVSPDSSIRPYFLVGSLFIIFNVIFFLFFPFPFNIGNPFPLNLPTIFLAPLTTAKNGPLIQSQDWYDVMLWLRNNTPDPGVNYYSLYNEPGIDKKTGKILPYDYPPEAYGVLARWDIGHMITYYAHRIPNANPFHQGVGEMDEDKITEIGEAVFFLENNEQKAIEYLNSLKTRYIITDYPDPEGIFRNRVKWLQGNMQGYDENSAPSIGPTKYDNSMMVRLHMLDGGGETISQIINGEKKDFLIQPLDHFRLVYESKNTVGLYKKDPNKEVKAVKIFEYVKGAKIVGFTKPGERVILSTEITTNQNRKFTYRKDFQSRDGYFEFIVPYSTFGKAGIIPGQTNFDVFASLYRLKIGDKEIKANVSEEDVLNGKIIKI